MRKKDEAGKKDEDLKREKTGSLGIAVVGYYRLCLQLAKAS